MKRKRKRIRVDWPPDVDWNPSKIFLFFLFFFYFRRTFIFQSIHRATKSSRAVCSSSLYIYRRAEIGAKRRCFNLRTNLYTRLGNPAPSHTIDRVRSSLIRSAIGCQFLHPPLPNGIGILSKKTVLCTLHWPLFPIYTPLQVWGFW